MNKIKPVYIVLLVFSLAALGFFYFKTWESKVVETTQTTPAAETTPTPEPAQTTPDGFYIERESCNFGILYGTKWLLLDKVQPAAADHPQATIQLDGDMSKATEIASLEDFDAKTLRLFEFKFINSHYGTFDVFNQLDISNIEPQGWKPSDADVALACLCNESVLKEKTRSKILYTLLENYTGEVSKEQLEKTAACDKSKEMEKIQKVLSERAEKPVAQ